MNYKQLIILITLLAWLPAQACHTPARSAVLGKLYPDTDFAKMMHQSHNQKSTG